jgi:hypothetical protein
VKLGHVIGEGELKDAPTNIEYILKIHTSDEGP